MPGPYCVQSFLRAAGSASPAAQGLRYSRSLTPNPVKGELMGRLKVLAAFVVAAFALGATGCGGGGGGESTLVFGTASDPTALDGALISDGESIRVLYQMTEGLTALRPGTSEVI